jgi:hypothetical protein
MIKIRNSAGLKKLVRATSFDQLLSSGRTKLELDQEVKLVLEDGFEVEDDDGVTYATDNKLVVVFLCQGETLASIAGTSSSTEPLALTVTEPASTSEMEATNTCENVSPTAG